MSNVKITYPDNSIKEFPTGVTGLEIAKAIGARLAASALAVKVDGIAQDLTEPISKDAKIEILTFDSKEGKEIFWHSACHLMSQAVQRVFKDPDIGLGVGPAIDSGFYQDYDMNPVGEADFEKIEDEMKKIVSEKLEIKHREAAKKDVLAFYTKDPYKSEMARDLPGETVTMYSQGEFDNMCKGPHVPNTSYLKAFKLLKVSGAYWRGDSKNKMLQRIYGIAFPEEKQLKEYLNVLEEAKKRNHLKIGKELDLFSMQDEAPGVPFFHPKGMALWNFLMAYWRREHFRRGYVEVNTPIIMKKTLWVQSGHWDHYKENMYFTKIDEEDYAVKPMNCPGHILIYKNKRHSYKELPIRMAEAGTVHRHELSGVLNGLFRVRKFTQDDAHIFCTEEQIKDEVRGIIDLIDFTYKKFGFEYHVELSTKPLKAMGSDEVWEKATNGLKEALESLGLDFKINEGDGAFYGPKIDFHIKDSLGRTWQCATVQLDFLMPENFDLTYIGSDDKPHRPVMLHRVVFGSIERFIGILTEHYAGKFPLWISPSQVVIFPINDSFLGYAQKVNSKLIEAGIRSELDLRNETVSAKVRDAQMMKFNYAVAVGQREADANTVSARNREGTQEVFGLDEFVAKLKKDIEDYK